MTATLNLLRYGPRHNAVLETRELIFGDVPILDYKWTPEVIVGSVTGREARVWVYKEHVQQA